MKVRHVNIPKQKLVFSLLLAVFISHSICAQQGDTNAYGTQSYFHSNSSINVDGAFSRPRQSCSSSLSKMRRDVDGALRQSCSSSLSKMRRDVDSAFSRPRQRVQTEADGLKKERENSERGLINSVKTTFEKKRLDSEKKLNKEMRARLEGNGYSDSVNNQSSSVSRNSYSNSKSVWNNKKNKVIPSIGATAITGKNGLDLESNRSFMLSVENIVKERVSINLAVGFTTMDIRDTHNRYAGSYNYGYRNNYSYGYRNRYSNYYNSYGYNNVYGEEGRDMDYSKVTFEINSKLFISVENSIKPYVGIGLAYNRHNLSYKNNDTYSGFGNEFQLGNEEFSSSYAAGTALIGSEIHFGENFGFNVEFKYQRGLGSSFYASSAKRNYNPDQMRLESVGKALEESDNMSLNCGFIIKF